MRFGLFRAARLARWPGKSPVESSASQPGQVSLISPLRRLRPQWDPPLHTRAYCQFGYRDRLGSNRYDGSQRHSSGGYQYENNGRQSSQQEWERLEEQQRINNKYGRLAPFYRYRKPIGWVLGGMALVYVTHLERAPVSGRWRFMLVPKWLEQLVGQRGYQNRLVEYGPHLLPEYHPTTKLVRRTMDRIIAVADMEPTDWRVHVVRGDFPPNAFVLPTGKVFVFESLLPICRNQDGLATVLSHETAHQFCRHTSESLSKAPIKLLIAIALYTITGIPGLGDFVWNLVLKWPASRSMEREADLVGLMMMGKACFKPSEAVNVWERMLEMEQSNGWYIPEFLSTHPASDTRIEMIREHLSEADQLRGQNCQGMRNFRAIFGK